MAAPSRLYIDTPGVQATASRGVAIAVVVSATLLLWPAVLNGYPIVFDDTGTYLSQAVHHYLGWDRPVFYSLFLLPLHLTVTTWPAIAVQALLAAYTIHLLRRTLLPDVAAGWLIPLSALLTVATALPWFAAELMPDLFTPLLVLGLTLLVLTPDRLSRAERIGLVLFCALMIASQLSSVPLSLALLLLLTPLRHWLGASSPLGRRGLGAIVAPVLLAVLALCSVNLLGVGRLTLSPYGNVFLLARVIYDGPGMDVLRRDCPRAGWRLCGYLDAFPASSDGFLWDPDSPARRAGGHKAMSAEAGSIIDAALHAEPGTELRAALRNGLEQLALFHTGDELHACPRTVSPWIQRDFPSFEQATYAAAIQTQHGLTVAPWLQVLHAVTALSGLAGCAVMLGWGWRRRHIAAGFAAATLLATVLNAFISGGLSAPHHRYGSRMMLLPPIVAILGGVALLRERRAPA